jgi:ABC-type antimicrobial peptide transport system permease subunit
MEKKHSGMGIASFIISLVMLFIQILIYNFFTTHGHSDSLGALILCFIANLVGVGLGIAGLAQKGRKRIFSVLGTTLNGIPSLVFLITVILT